MTSMLYAALGFVLALGLIRWLKIRERRLLAKSTKEVARYPADPRFWEKAAKAAKDYQLVLARREGVPIGDCNDLLKIELDV